MASLAIIGFLYLNRKIFANALFILLVTPAINAYLKLLWKLPLPPGVGTHTYAFPSGHLHAALVFWGFLAISYKNLPWRIFVSGFLILNAWAIYAKGYHYPIDLFGALFFAVLSLIIFYLLLKQSYIRHSPPITGIVFFLTGSILILANQEISVINQAVIPALGALLGFSLGWTLTRWSECIKFNDCDNLKLLLPNSNMKAKLFLIWALGLAAMVYTHFHLLPEEIFSSPDLRKFIGFFMIALWIAASPISVISYPNEKEKNA